MEKIFYKGKEIGYLQIGNAADGWPTKALHLNDAGCAMAIAQAGDKEPLEYRKGETTRKGEAREIKAMLTVLL